MRNALFILTALVFGSLSIKAQEQKRFDVPTLSKDSLIKSLDHERLSFELNKSKLNKKHSIYKTLVSKPKNPELYTMLNAYPISKKIKQPVPFLRKLE